MVALQLSRSAEPEANQRPFGRLNRPKRASPASTLRYSQYFLSSTGNLVDHKLLPIPHKHPRHPRHPRLAVDQATWKNGDLCSLTQIINIKGGDFIHFIVASPSSPVAHSSASLLRPPPFTTTTCRLETTPSHPYSTSDYTILLFYSYQSINFAGI